MDSRYTLSLPEAVLLLAIDERSGAVRGGGELRHGLAGAMLIELSLHGRLKCEGRSLTAVDRLRTGDALLDEALSLMRRAAAPRPVRSWLLRITRALHDLQPRYLDRLAREGIVRHERSRALGLFSANYYPLLTLGSRYSLVERLRQIALADTSAKPREIALLRLLEACGLLEVLFARAELRLVRSRMATYNIAEPMSRLIAAEVASLRQDSTDFAYIVGIG